MPSVVHIHEVADYQQQVRRAIELLGGGKLVVLPTETVYGAAADISNPDGKRRLSELRGGEKRPFIVHLGRREDAANYLADVSELAERMMMKLWPGPVGLVFDVPEERRREVASEFSLEESDLFENGTITLRCPDHVVASDVLSHVNRPVALSLVHAKVHADDSLQWDEAARKADMILDAGPTRFLKPSTIVRVKDDHWQIIREGIYDHRIIERLLRTTVLFVCSGNTCRSPMAEALAKRIFAEKLGVSQEELENRGITVVSAGSFALPGAKATPQAVDAVKQLGGDLSRHRSRPLSVELIHQADFIFTMSRNHARDVIALVPAASEKTLMLDPERDIEDPIGGDESLYLELAKQLDVLIEKRLAEKQLA